MSVVSESESLFGEYRLRAARFQKLTTRALSKEMRIWKQKISPGSLVFFELLSGNSPKRFFGATRWSHEQ